MYGVSERTVYNWFERFEERPLEAALFDDDRPGRPPELSEERRETLEEVVAEPPSQYEFDADEWTAELLRRYVTDRFDVAYSKRHAYRLLEQIRTA